MGLASPFSLNLPGNAQGWSVTGQVVSGAVLGILCAAVVAASMSAKAGPMIPVALMVVLPALAAVVLRPRVGVLMLFFAMGFIEEFRGGIGDTGAGGDEALRSERTPFYAKTIGLPSLYMPDVMIGGILFLYLAKAVLWRNTLGMRLDKIGLGLVLLALALVLSIVVPLMGPQPFGPAILDLSTLGSITLPEKNVSDVARYLPVLQYKLFFILFPAYLVGLVYFQQTRDIEQMLRVLGIAMAATVLLGLYRVVRDPGMIRMLVPVIFDTGSVALMAMTVFYLIGRWASGHYAMTRSVIYTLLAILLMLLILLSFRRTMWGAIALAIPLFPFIIPRHAWRRLFILVGIGLGLGLLVLVATSPGQALLHSVLSRAAETHLNQSSTLYRFAIMTWLVENFFDIPAFGYGLQPMWNEKVYIRFFYTSMENVHSLYIWLIMRMGLVGFTISGAGLMLVLWRMWEVYRSLKEEQYRILVGVIFLSLVMYFFNGLFNPVYANVRHLVPLGLALALVTQLPSIAARARQSTPLTGAG
ncbi:MAG: O-antigen ligase family protein [Pseudomonadota bacterium]